MTLTDVLTLALALACWGAAEAVASGWVRQRLRARRRLAALRKASALRPSPTAATDEALLAAEQRLAVLAGDVLLLADHPAVRDVEALRRQSAFDRGHRPKPNPSAKSPPRGSKAVPTKP